MQQYKSPILLLLAGFSLFTLAGCGSSSTATTNPTNPTQPAQQSGTVSMLVSDSPTDDWATIGVKVAGIALVPQSGGSPVTVYTAPSTPPEINLVQLDQLGEILGNDATIPTGTYSSVNLTLAANNNGTTCDVDLVASGDPDSDFDAAAGSSIPCSQIVIAGAQGTAPNMTVPLSINLESPLTVTASSSNVLDLDFDLNDPALIVEHMPAGSTAPTWVVNFDGPVHHHPWLNLANLVLRHAYGQVNSVSQDNSSITMSRAFAVHPITSPETAIVDSNHTLTINADATNGTLFYNLDTGASPSTVDNFSSVASTLPNMFVRIAARYQQNGTLVATRIYASSTFDKIWQNPEGHVLHVNTSTNVMWVTTEDGKAKRIGIGPDTAFYFQANNTAIGTGTSFFGGTTPGGLPNLARGFKVNVTIDPLSTATPPAALTVEIDVARYDGSISNPTGTNFDYTRNFLMGDGRGGKDDYTGSIGYATGAGVDQQGNAVNGFYWWNFGFPTKEDEGSSAVNDFVSATGGSVNFGGTVGALKPQGISHAVWNDAAAANTWSADWTVLTPVPAPLGLISSAFATGTNSFSLTVPLPVSASNTTPLPAPVTIDLSVATGSATLVYQVDRQGGVITITPQDISNPTTLATVAQNLAVNVPVKVFGVPQVDGSMKAYVLLYYTHTASTK